MPILPITLLDGEEQEGFRGTQLLPQVSRNVSTYILSLNINAQKLYIIYTVLIEGAVFLVLALTGARFAMAKLIPEPIRMATAPGIGAFLAHLGLQTSNGLGLVVSDIATAVTLGACPLEKRTPIVAYDDDCANNGICITSDAYTCDVLGGRMTSATTWIGLLGLVIMIVFLSYKRNYGIIVGIFFVTIISWFRNTAVTYFPDTPQGDERFEYFSQVVEIESINLLFAKYGGDLQAAVLALFTFLYVDFLDTTGTFLGLVSHMGLLDENGDFPRSRLAFSADAIATMLGSLFGLSPVTSFVESAAGVEAGGKTGVTALVAGFYFLLSIFFAPIFASIPPWATGGSLVLVGSLMCRNLPLIKWHRADHAVTAFATIILMPLTYSIAYGIVGGILIWTVVQCIFYALKLVGIPLPYSEDEEEISDDIVKPKHIGHDEDPTVHVGKDDEPEGELELETVEEEAFHTEQRTASVLSA